MTIDIATIANRAREFAAAQEEASPGPWVFDESEAGTANGDAYWGLISGEDDPWLRRPLGVHVRFRSCGLFGNSKSPEGEEEQARCDAKMIVAARNSTLASDVLALVDRLREAEELLRDWMENTSHYDDTGGETAVRCHCDRCNQTAAFLRQGE